MSIQLLLMRSGEEVIADVYEMRDEEQKPVAFILRSPQIVRIMPKPDDPGNPNVTFENWVPLSPQQKFLIKEDAFLTICDPLEPLVKHFIERFGETDDELAGNNSEKQSVPPEPTGGE